MTEFGINGTWRSFGLNGIWCSLELNDIWRSLRLNDTWRIFRLTGTWRSLRLNGTWHVKAVLTLGQVKHRYSSLSQRHCIILTSNHISSLLCFLKAQTAKLTITVLLRKLLYSSIMNEGIQTREKLMGKLCKTMVQNNKT